jgi:hypothetical protein
VRELLVVGIDRGTLAPDAWADVRDRGMDDMSWCFLGLRLLKTPAVPRDVLRDAVIDALLRLAIRIPPLSSPLVSFATASRHPPLARTVSQKSRQPRSGRQAGDEHGTRA